MMRSAYAPVPGAGYRLVVLGPFKVGERLSHVRIGPLVQSVAGSYNSVCVAIGFEATVTGDNVPLAEVQAAEHLIQSRALVSGMPSFGGFGVGSFLEVPLQVVVRQRRYVYVLLSQADVTEWPTFVSVVSDAYDET